MSGYFFERHFPGTTTCVVVGPLARGQAPAGFASARAIVWCDETADRAGSALAVPPGCAVHHVPLARARHDWLPALEKLVQRDASHLPSVFVTEQIVGPHTDHYLALLADLQVTLDRHHRARETRQKDGFTWQRHLFANLPAYVSRRVPASWAGALRGVPAFICGAGPSLDVTAPLLAAHRSRGLVFAADSALRGLARHGVTPKHHVTLTRFGIGKCRQMEFSEDSAVTIFRILVGALEGGVDVDRIRIGDRKARRSVSNGDAANGRVNRLGD